MKKLYSILTAVAFVLTITFVGSCLVNAQETTMGKAGDTVEKTAKKVYKKSYRVGTTIGTKTWNGSKWVASKTWKGGKWVAVKTKNGSKWVYYKAKNTVAGAKKPVM